MLTCPVHHVNLMHLGILLLRIRNEDEVKPLGILLLRRRNENEVKPDAHWHPSPKEKE